MIDYKLYKCAGYNSDLWGANTTIDVRDSDDVMFEQGVRNGERELSTRSRDQGMMREVEL